MNNLSAFNRMLTVKFKLMMDWYTNKGQMSSTTLNVMMCHSSIGSVYEMIFKNQLVGQRDHTVL